VVYVEQFVIVTLLDVMIAQNEDTIEKAGGERQENKA